jgi:hypothetical protein
MPISKFELSQWLALGLAVAAASCVARHVGRAPQAPWTPAAPFTVTFWCGPPLAEFTDARAAEIAAAGFTLVGSPCEGDINPDLNRRALEVAARHGLRMSVADPRFSRHAVAHPGWESRLAAAVADYRTHPGLGAYFVDDEPTAAEFGAVAAVVGQLRAADPAHPAYVNLLPDFVKPEDLGTDSYEQYLARFVDTVRPQLLSYDYYPFKKDEHGKDRDRPTFFSNLALMREQALRHDLPFMLIVLAMPHARYRDPTEAELRWQVLHALAFGARGISYFAYWTPVHVGGAEQMKFRHGLIEDGAPTVHYFDAARLNRKVLALAAALAPFRTVATATSRDQPVVGFPIGPIESVSGGPVTIGLFSALDGRLAVLVVNSDYRRAITARLHLHAGTPAPEVFDPDTRSWQTAGSAIALEAGDAALLRWP